MTRIVRHTYLYLSLISIVACVGLAAIAEEPAVDVEIKKIIAAAGGEENLLKLFRLKERLNVSSDAAKKGNERVSILEPPKYWWLGKSERAAEPAKLLVWAWTLGALKDPSSKVDLIPEIIELEKPAIGLKISGSVEPPMDLYFDKELSHLVRIDWRSDIHRFSEWQDRGGIRYPAKCVGYKKSSGNAWYFSEILEVERLDELPEGLVR